MCEMCEGLFKEKARTALRRLGFRGQRLTAMLIAEITKAAHEVGIWDWDCGEKGTEIVPSSLHSTTDSAADS